MKAAPFSRQWVTVGKVRPVRDQLEQREAGEQAKRDIMIQTDHRRSPNAN